jgi:two-component system NtrC family sensor kinase
VVLVTVISTVHLTGRIDRATAERDQVHRDLLRSGKLASLGELATGLAHEINNPLAIISAEQTNIADQVEELVITAEAREGVLASVARCKRQIARCSGITSKMLQFGRKTEARPVPTAIGPLVAEAVELMRRQAAVRNIDLTLDLEDDLPRAVVDGTELEQVLINLIKNGMEAIDGRGSINVDVGHLGAELLVAVSDNGSGIALEDMDRVFQPFFTTKPVGQGTGMGLAVCYGIVRGWGGTISVESAPGHGTTMTVHLPVSDTG